MTKETSRKDFIDGTTRSLASSFLRQLGGATALGIFLCLKYKDDTSACSHSIDPNAYNDAETFRRDYISSKLLSKWSLGLKEEVKAREERAVDKFLDCEAYLGSRAEGLRTLLSHPNTQDGPCGEILYTAREIILEILGPSPKDFDVDLCNFGPGSSTSVPRRKAHPSQKFVATDVTSSCRTFVHWFFRDIGSQQIPMLRTVEGSEISIVRKNFKSDRVIAKEPDWNIFFQKGLGSLLRRLLKKVGIDLDRGAERHELLARSASITGLSATVDLTSASDLILTSLIRFLFPDQWFILMNSLRTSEIKVKNQTIHLRKFSSMGNGFTFELESLVFYAIAKACVNHVGGSAPVSVFGDDIILESKAVSLLKQVFDACGFRLNEEKSFFTGYFRESCGAHFFDGLDCKPIYLKKALNNDFEKFKFCNSIRSLSHRLYHCDFGDTPLFSVYTDCVNRIRRVFYIPEGFGDGGLVEKFDKATPAGLRRKDRNVRRYPNCIEGYKVRCLLPTTLESEAENFGMYIYKMRSHCRPLEINWLTTALNRPKICFDYHRYIPRPFEFDDPKELGNSYSTKQQNVRYRVGFIHVTRWVDPES